MRGGERERERKRARTTTRERGGRGRGRRSRNSIEEVFLKSSNRLWLLSLCPCKSLTSATTSLSRPWRLGLDSAAAQAAASAAKHAESLTTRFIRFFFFLEVGRRRMEIIKTRRKQKKKGKNFVLSLSLSLSLAASQHRDCDSALVLLFRS